MQAFGGFCRSWVFFRWLLSEWSGEWRRGPGCRPATAVVGQYNEVIRACEKAVAEQDRSEEWRLMLIQTLLDVGRYRGPNRGDERPASDSRSIRLPLAGPEALQANGDSARAAALLERSRNGGGRAPIPFRDPPSLVVFGRSALALGIDPKAGARQDLPAGVQGRPRLEGCLPRPRGIWPCRRMTLPWREGVRRGTCETSGDPDLHYGRARAFSEGDREEMVSSLEAALKINPRHVPSLLLLAEHRVDSGDYAERPTSLDASSP